MKKPLLLMTTLLLVLGLFVWLPTNSEATWSQEFNESGVGDFNWIEMYSVSGPGFFVPAFSGFDDGSWSTIPQEDALHAVATGGVSTNLNFYITFAADDTSVPFSFDFLAWNDETLREVANAVWDGTTWTITPGDCSKYEENPPSASVPEPATLLLLGTALVGLAGFSRKRALK